MLRVHESVKIRRVQSHQYSTSLSGEKKAFIILESGTLAKIFAARGATVASAASDLEAAQRDDSKNTDRNFFDTAFLLGTQRIF